MQICDISLMVTSGCCLTKKKHYGHVSNHTLVSLLSFNVNGQKCLMSTLFVIVFIFSPVGKMYKGFLYIVVEPSVIRLLVSLLLPV